MAIATAKATQRYGSSIAHKKVTNPSGILCIQIANAVTNPALISCFFIAGVLLSDQSCNSCGFAADGIHASINAINNIHQKKHANAYQNPNESPYNCVKAILDFPKISTSETNIITQAENHKAHARNFLFVCLAKNTVAHHIAVLNHAHIVNNIANVIGNIYINT